MNFDLQSEFCYSCYNFVAGKVQLKFCNYGNSAFVHNDVPRIARITTHFLPFSPRD